MVQSRSADGCTSCACTIICGAGLHGGVAPPRTRTARHRSCPYLDHLKDGTATPVSCVAYARAATNASCVVVVCGGGGSSATEADCGRVPAVGVGTIAGRSETVHGTASGSVEMTVPGAGKHGTGEGDLECGGASSDDESRSYLDGGDIDRLVARTRRDCDRRFGCGDRDRGGAYAAAAGGIGGMIAGSVVSGLGVDAVNAVEVSCCISRVDKDAFAVAG